MFEDKTTMVGYLNSPMNIASATLDEIQSRLTGTQIIADPNSPFCHLLEFGSSITAMAISAVEDKFPQLYAKRATSAEELFHHMSDYDYLRMYSTPAQTELLMLLSKDYLSSYALDYNTNYKKVTIPKDTVFMVGKYTFGLYYPIDILINNFSGTFTAVYDTSYTNPLYTLTQNVVDKYDTEFSGLEFVGIKFPIYQFSKSTIEESLMSETGFAKKISYNNQFYAVRLFSYKSGVYTELSQTQSEIIYDVSNPTARVQILSDEQAIKITIPQIYFDNGVLGTKIFIEVYTTLGELDIDTANISTTSIQASFAKSSRDTTVYSAILQSLPSDLYLSLSSDKIAGGSDAISLDTLRDRVVNDTLYETVPITEDELSVYLEDNGFYIKKYKDNVTDRIYHAYRVLEDGSGGIIPSMTIAMRVQQSYADTYSTFVSQSDGSITIMPNAVFVYNESTQDATPISDAEMAEFVSMDKAALAETLNNTQYFQTPFHMRVDLSDQYPETISYNLMTPTVNSTIFDAENYSLSLKATLFGATVTHLDGGIGGYQVVLTVSKSDDLNNLNEDDVVAYAVVKTSSGFSLGVPCAFNSSNGTISLYTFQIDSNYHLDSNGELGITNFVNTNEDSGTFNIPLTSDFYIVFLVKKSVIEGEYTEASSTLTQGVPGSVTDEYVGLTRQHVNITLGYSLADVIRNDMNLSYTSDDLVVWDHNEPARYTEDQYERDAYGALVYSYDEEGNISLNKVYEEGEQVRDEYGNLVWSHYKGEVRFDSDGEPMVATGSDNVYYIDTMFIDAKVFVSERSAETTFVSSIHSTLEGYFTLIRNLQEQLLERTNIFFRCVRSTGSASFNLGDGVTSTQNIEMTFKIRCYVPSYVKQDETIQANITERTCDAIEAAIQTKTISMLDIFHEVKEKLSDSIEHFTLLGINGYPDMQTFTVLSEDAQPSIAKQLELTDDNVLSLNRQVSIEYVALEDNTASSV